MTLIGYCGHCNGMKALSVVRVSTDIRVLHEALSVLHSGHVHSAMYADERKLVRYTTNVGPDVREATILEFGS